MGRAGSYRAGSGQVGSDLVRVRSGSGPIWFGLARVGSGQVGSDPLWVGSDLVWVGPGRVRSGRVQSSNVSFHQDI